MNKISAETMVSLRAAAKLLPGRPHISTLHRWRRGLSDGRRLETVKIGGKIFTSVEACRRFALAGQQCSTTLERAFVNSEEEIERQLDSVGLTTNQERSGGRTQVNRP